MSASAIDIVLVLSMSLLIMEPVKSWLPETVDFLFRLMSGALPDGQPEGVVLGLHVLARLFTAITLVSPLYFLCEVFFGRAPGKFALRLRVTAAAPGDTSFLPRLSRYAAKQAAPLLVLVGALASLQGICRAGELVGYITVLGFFVALTRRRRALHDLLGGTVVVRHIQAEPASPRVS